MKTPGENKTEILESGLREYSKKLGGDNPTPKQLTAMFRQSVSDSDEMFLTENNAIKAIEMYWQQRLNAYKTEQGRKYSKSEVSTLIKKALDDAAERARIKVFGPDGFPLEKTIDKESITSIDVNQYLTK
jgi:23S rRNA pseudoU1915 N3-methylase RlmH